MASIPNLYDRSINCKFAHRGSIVFVVTNMMVVQGMILFLHPQSARRLTGVLGMEIIYVRSLTKKFGVKTVLDNVSLSVKSGCSTVLLGLNGAGKNHIDFHFDGVTNSISRSGEAFWPTTG